MKKSRKSSVKKLSVSSTHKSNGTRADEDGADRFLDACLREPEPPTIDELVDIVRVLGHWAVTQDPEVVNACLLLGRSNLCIKITDALSKHFQVGNFSDCHYGLLDSELTHQHLAEVLCLLGHMV